MIWNAIVVEGHKIGRTLGFPTANLRNTQQPLLLESGVYAATVLWEGKMYIGMANIGHRPSFNGTEKSIEVNIFDFSESIYGDEVQIDFLHKIRDEKKFSSKEELILQLQKDKEQVISLLGASKL